MIVAIAFVERRVSSLTKSVFDSILDGKMFEISDLDSVSDSMYEWLKFNKVSSDFFETQWFKNLLNKYGGMSDDLLIQ